MLPLVERLGIKQWEVNRDNIGGPTRVFLAIPPPILGKQVFPERIAMVIERQPAIGDKHVRSAKSARWNDPFPVETLKGRILQENSRQDMASAKAEKDTVILQPAFARVVPWIISRLKHLS